MKAILPLRKWRLNTWQTVLLFGIFLMVVTGPSVFFFDYLVGSSTVGFAASPPSGYQGIGMFYLYMVSYFTSVVVILPALLTGRFGAAFAVFLPYVVLGFPVNYYFERVVNHTWVSAWSGLGWTAAFLLTGLSVDFSLRYLPVKLNSAIRSSISGAIMALVSFAVTVAALSVVYIGPLPTGPGSFVGIAYFGLPWMIVSSALGGYTAYALARDLS